MFGAIMIAAVSKCTTKQGEAVAQTDLQVPCTIPNLRFMMAKLEGRDTHIGPKWIKLEPIKSPYEGHDATEYLLQIWPDVDGSVKTYVFSVSGWQMQHDDAWVFARAFAEAPLLVSTTVPIDLWR